MIAADIVIAWAKMTEDECNNNYHLVQNEMCSLKCHRMKCAVSNAIDSLELLATPSAELNNT